MKTAYYNDIDAGVCDWLRELLADALIPAGVVDRRSIKEVTADDIGHFSQCHFFAGISGWPEALRLAGYGDLSVWTGSCPCQPYSDAGKRAGDADERNLWPEFRRLIALGRPAVVFGEQVASKAGRDWLAGVRADLEELGYAFGAADLCAAGAGETAEGWIVRGDSGRWERIVVGAPNIRQRLWWGAVRLADAAGIMGDGRQHEPRREAQGRIPDRWSRARIDGLADADARDLRDRQPGATGGIEFNHHHSIGRLADAAGQRCGEAGSSIVAAGTAEMSAGSVSAGGLGHASPPGFSITEPQKLSRSRRGSEGRTASKPGCSCWSDFVVILCRDGKARRISVEPEIFPLAHGIPNRVVTLRGAGNAINPHLAAEFITTFMESVEDLA